MTNSPKTRTTSSSLNPSAPTLEIPDKLLNDANQPLDIGVPDSLDQLPHSSAPNYTLYKLIGHLQPKSILEIGTQFGASAIAMALAQQANGDTPDVMCIDPFLRTTDNDGPSFLNDWYENIERAGMMDHIKLMMTTSEHLLPMLNKRFDFVFVDGSHHYKHVRQDCLWTIQRLNVGGYFVAHDYVIYDQVQRGCDQAIAKFDFPFHVNRQQRNGRGELCGWVIAKKTRPVSDDAIDRSVEVHNKNVARLNAEPLRAKFQRRFNRLLGKAA